MFGYTGNDFEILFNKVQKQQQTINQLVVQIQQLQKQIEQIKQLLSDDGK